MQLSNFRNVSLKTQPLIVFTYSFPHRKTNDFLKIIGQYRNCNVVVVGAPFKNLTSPLKPNFHLSKYKELDSTKNLCEFYKFEYIECPHEDYLSIKSNLKNSEDYLGLIAGARILPKSVIELCQYGIINFHPGKLPETSGLDSFYYAIAKSCLMGVTCHLIDERVDAGQLIQFDNIAIYAHDTSDVIIERLYQTQLNMLDNLMKIDILDLSKLSLIHRPSKNTPMTQEEKKRTMLQFENYKKRFAAEKV